MTIDLNCDLGEGTGNDADIMPFISSANIACGYHAGDEFTINNTIELCLEHNVAVGAHPGFFDKPNFGRIPVQLNQHDLYQLIWDQLAIMQTACDKSGARLHHVKPHGALYNMAAVDEQVSLTICKAVHAFNSNLVYYGLSGSIMISAAQSIGLKTAREVFADRTYQPDGTLTPRTHSSALIVDSKQAVNQVMQLVNQQSVTTIEGRIIALHADTICLHGDGAQAVALAKQIHQNLLKEGIAIASF
jgi:5-oxoprolinase (ATP-hydrolysing) subunit A